MLPAPTTIAISSPVAWVREICAAMRATRLGSVPYSSSPIRASPESFSMTRSNARSPSLISSTGFRSVLGADLEAGEAGDPDVLAGLHRSLRPELLDRLAVVLLGVDVGLVEQRDLLAP